MTSQYLWLFNGKEFTSDNIEDSYGFVYLITNTQSGRLYIGRKYFFSIRKVKGKKRRQRFESNWKNYWGSSIHLLEDIKNLGKEQFKREILSIHKTKGDVNYTEVKQLFRCNVLETDLYYNDNISARWFSKPQHIIEGRRTKNDMARKL